MSQMVPLEKSASRLERLLSRAASREPVVMMRYVGVDAVRRNLNHTGQGIQYIHVAMVYIHTRTCILVHVSHTKSRYIPASLTYT